MAALVAAVLLGVRVLAQTRPSAQEPPGVSPRTIARVAGASYVGGETCKQCHGAESITFGHTGHAAIVPSKADSVTSCEMCHGPGGAHVTAMQAAGDDDKKIEAAKKLIFAFNGNPKATAERCLTCHISSRDQKDFSRSTHMQHGVACNNCHSMHLVEVARTPTKTSVGMAQANFFSVPKLTAEKRWLGESLLAKPQFELCAGCHGNIQSQFALPTHHRVPEGAMKCTDCHNTHGSANLATLRQSGWETCAQCHIEKRGPFVFEHSAVKVQGCVACHTPHGSVNRNLLARREERFTCLSCHVAPTAANVPHSRLSFQTRGDCTRCHASIHGSNFDKDFLH
jgi:predicted CXXCH cytochrome family protein